MKNELVGMGEICELTNVTLAAVWNWRTRHDDFPIPLADLAMGPVFDKKQILAWLKLKGKVIYGTTGRRRIKIR